MRLINGDWVAKDTMVGQGLFYRTVTLTHNDMSNTPVSYQPDITLSASNILTTSATLNGSDIPVASNTVCWFEYGTDTNYYGGTTQTTNLDTSTNTVILSLPVVGLLPATLYHFQLVVTNDWTPGTAPELGGDQTFTTLGLPPVVVTTPGPQVFSNSPTSYSALLNGTVNPEGGPTAAWFLYYSDTTSGQTTPQDAGSNNSPNIFYQVARNLLPNTAYHFEIVASNSVGISYGQPYQPFTTAPPAPPAVETKDATYTGHCIDCSPVIPVLNGTVNGNGASFTGYFQYGLDTNNYSMNTSQFNGANSSPQQFSITLTNVTLNASTIYHYRIVAFNGPSEGVGGDKTFTTP